MEECPLVGALHMVGQGSERHVDINPAICNGCGCCVAVCPNRALQVNGWALDQYEAMVDAIVADPVEVSS